MIVLLAVLALLLFGFGFTVHFLWIVLVACVIILLLGYALDLGTFRRRP